MDVPEPASRTLKDLFASCRKPFQPGAVAVGEGERIAAPGWSLGRQFGQVGEQVPAVVDGDSGCLKRAGQLSEVTAHYL